jgi:hypothetical protein
VKAELAAAVAGEARLRAGLERVATLAATQGVTFASVVSEAERVLAEQPSAALAGLRGLREAAAERQRYCQELDWPEPVMADLESALAATAWVGEGEAGDG